jgi:hypothetical protein
MNTLLLMLGSQIKKWFKFILVSIPISLVLSLLIKDDLTELLFSGKSFSGRSADLQLMLFTLYFIVFALFISLIIFLIHAFFPRLPNRIIKFFTNLNIVLITKIKSLKKWEDSLLRRYTSLKVHYTKRLYLGLFLLGICLSFLFFINNVLSTINTRTWRYQKLEVIPAEFPLGVDFRNGLYKPAQAIMEGSYSSISFPPLVSVINIPYLIFSENTAYLVHIGMIFLANIACLVLVSYMAREYLFSGLGIEEGSLSLLILFILISFLMFTFSSYGFMFSIERGQWDIFALFFSLLAILVLLKYPRKIWLQIIFLSIATHMKIYPAVVFLPLIIKHGKKIILPTLLINAIFLFIRGPKIAFDFFENITVGANFGAGINNKEVWVGNHAAYSMAVLFAENILKNASLSLFLWIGLTLIPLTLWIIATIKLFREKYSGANTILFLMISIPLMNVIPLLSEDYRLVLLNSAALLLMALIFRRIIQRFHLPDFLQLIIVILVLLFIHRPFNMDAAFSYALASRGSYLIDNKYIWILALEALMVINIFSNSYLCNNETKLRN